MEDTTIESLSTEEHDRIAETFGVDAELHEQQGRLYVLTISEFDGRHDEPFLLVRSEKGKLEAHDGDGFDWYEFAQNDLTDNEKLVEDEYTDWS